MFRELLIHENCEYDCLYDWTFDNPGSHLKEDAKQANTSAIPSEIGKDPQSVPKEDVSSLQLVPEVKENLLDQKEEEVKEMMRKEPKAEDANSSADIFVGSNGHGKDNGSDGPGSGEDVKSGAEGETHEADMSGGEDRRKEGSDSSPREDLQKEEEKKEHDESPSKEGRESDEKDTASKKGKKKKKKKGKKDEEEHEDKDTAKPEKKVAVTMKDLFRAQGRTVFYHEL